jgi:hypothetical protein
MLSGFQYGLGDAKIQNNALNTAAANKPHREKV